MSARKHGGNNANYDNKMNVSMPLSVREWESNGNHWHLRRSMWHLFYSNPKHCMLAICKGVLIRHTCLSTTVIVSKTHLNETSHVSTLCCKTITDMFECLNYLSSHLSCLCKIWVSHSSHKNAITLTLVNKAIFSLHKRSHSLRIA